MLFILKHLTKKTFNWGKTEISYTIHQRYSMVLGCEQFQSLSERKSIMAVQDVSDPESQSLSGSFDPLSCSLIPPWMPNPRKGMVMQAIRKGRKVVLEEMPVVMPVPLQTVRTNGRLLILSERKKSHTNPHLSHWSYNAFTSCRAQLIPKKCTEDCTSRRHSFDTEMNQNKRESKSVPKGFKFEPRYKSKMGALSKDLSVGESSFGNQVAIRKKLGIPRVRSLPIITHTTL